MKQDSPSGFVFLWSFPQSFHALGIPLGLSLQFAYSSWHPGAREEGPSGNGKPTWDLRIDLFVSQRLPHGLLDKCNWLEASRSDPKSSLTSVFPAS